MLTAANTMFIAVTYFMGAYAAVHTFGWTYFIIVTIAGAIFGALNADRVNITLRSTS